MIQKTNAVQQFAAAKVRQITNMLKGKAIPNMYQIEDTVGFGIRITEGELNFAIQVTAVPIPEAGEGNFVVYINNMFYKPAVIQQGFQFEPVPEGKLVEMHYPLYAEHEQELVDGILQILHDDVENILCQLLD